MQFDIDAILPKSIVIADSFAEKDQSFILIYGDEVSRVIAISKNGLLVFSTSFQLESIKEKFNQVITYAERYLNFSTIKVIFSGVDENTVLEKKSKYIAANVDIIASQNLADFRNLAGADKKVLNLQLKKNSLSTVSDVTDLSSVDDTLDLFEEDTQVKSNLFIGLLVFISIIGVGVGFFVIKFLLNS